MARLMKRDYCVKSGGLVVAIWSLAGPALADLFEQALSRVSGL
ncbi:hypothetical protein FHX68_0844 [Microbacterium lacticum]|uniref:Uncharacterized protein n=1 Tax=Microbacterium lacticum TaxID=33885 RepID=A0A543L075_9MICO|nr:hypothetical protein FHX68_0844 [Microbacterium lacticum]